jgi:predicted transcriptional regulator
MLLEIDCRALINAREALLLSRNALACKADLDLATIVHLENGRSCRMETLRKVIRALGYEQENHPFFKAKGDS